MSVIQREAAFRASSEVRPKAVGIVGATGLSGSYTGRLLKQHGWTVVTLSRGAADLDFSDRHIAAEAWLRKKPNDATVRSALAELQIRAGDLAGFQRLGQRRLVFRPYDRSTRCRQCHGLGDCWRRPAVLGSPFRGGRRIRRVRSAGQCGYRGPGDAHQRIAADGDNHRRSGDR
mgnify:CR=1 FL=1